MSEAKAPKKKTYLELFEEHQELEKLMAAAKADELQDVITEMKSSILKWGITAEQLGFVMPAPVAPAQPDKPKSDKPKKPAQKIERDKYGNSIKYLPDGSLKPFYYVNPANPNIKAYKDGREPNWLKKLKAEKADEATYIIKQP